MPGRPDKRPPSAAGARAGAGAELRPRVVRPRHRRLVVDAPAAELAAPATSLGRDDARPAEDALRGAEAVVVAGPLPERGVPWREGR